MRFHPAVAPLPLKPGQRLHFAGDSHPWTVKAVSEHFAALARAARVEDFGDVDAPDWPVYPDHVDNANAYTVLDWRNGVRGPCDLSGQGWGDGTYTQVECTAMLVEFEAGELEVSHRNQVPIEITEVSA